MRRGPHVLLVVGVRGHFLAVTSDSNHIDHKRPTRRSAALDAPDIPSEEACCGMALDGIDRE
jgi:hypothetical protein